MLDLVPPTSRATPLPVPTPEQSQEESEWETSMVEEGVKRFRTTLTERALPDTPPGLVAVKAMMARLVPAVAADRAAALDFITNAGKGRQPLWYWMFPLLPADVLAFIAVHQTIGHAATNAVRSGPCISRASVLSLKIGTAVMEEAEFAKWRRTSADTAKKDDSVDICRMMLERAKGNVSRMTYSRWKKKIASIERFKWSREDRLAVGAKLLETAVIHGGGWLEIVPYFVRGKTEQSVELTPVAMAALADATARLEIARPFCLPMLCPPAPWTRRPTTEETDSV